MEAGFYAIAVLSVIYYFIVVWHTKRFKNTFLWFWLAFAAMNLILGFVVSKVPDQIDYMILTVCFICAVIFFAIEVIILCSMVVLVPKKLDCIVVLGAQVRGKKVSGVLKRRLDRAIRYLEENPGTFCIVSGGKGKDEEITEAQAMEEYLVAHGIAKESICKEEQSHSTYENLENAMLFLEGKKREKIGVVTSNFHVYRAMKITRILGYKKVFAIPANSDFVMFANYMVREFFAVIVMFMKYKKR